jgi:uncharacterized protein YidB (DUF937 family)
MTPSVFDSLIQVKRLSPADARLAAWIIDRLLRSGTAEGLQRLVDDMRANGMGAQLDSWLGGGKPQQLSEEQFGNLSKPNGLFDPAEVKALTQSTDLDESQLRRRLAQLLPGIVSALMPRGEVPSWRALQSGLTTMMDTLQI